MTRATIGLRAVSNYDPDRVLASLRACLEPLGGMGAFVQPGQRVLLKPNLLGSFAPDRAVTTHPAVVRATALLVREAGGQVLIGDSPGMGTLAWAARGCGIDPVLNETGATLLDFSAPHEFDAPQNVMARRLTLTRALLEADVLISLPKLKTHAQMTFTGALKNQFGLIPGSRKSQWHFRLQQREWLASLILDINLVARPALAIMDGIVAMEGPGPSGGKPRFLGALLASRDLTALDLLACHLIHLDPRRVPLQVAAKEQDYGVSNLADLEVVGDNWQELRLKDFVHVDKLVDLNRLVPLPPFARNWIRRFWTAKPRIRLADCTRCGICRDGCPVKPSAIDPHLADGQQVNDTRCILCYCCHEFCPSHAIDLEQSWPARYLSLDALADQVASMLSRFSRRNRE
jgi:uncharacterized protein (DUF362 family)/Pyruvate/2-oxoacid:ferredoxin oxidoreductase delta subunit